VIGIILKASGANIGPEIKIPPIMLLQHTQKIYVIKDL